MLTRLSIRNIARINAHNLDFARRLGGLTGEAGRGSRSCSMRLGVLLAPSLRTVIRMVPDETMKRMAQFTRLMRLNCG
jgi:DNA repair ATPase RecN